MPIITLKTRKQFLWVRGGKKRATPSLVLEARRKPKPSSLPAAPTDRQDDDPHFGFTVTKKVGNAVVRNRIKRRLREVVRKLAPTHAKRGYDYVLIGRKGAISRDFADIVRDLERAFPKVHGAPK